MKDEMFKKMLANINTGKFSVKKLQTLYSNAERQGGEQGREMMEYIIKYSERNETALYRKLVPESNVSRKQFMVNEGFTCANWLWAWSFVNHEEKIIAFGAWNTAYIDECNVVILNESWRGKEREASGYNHAVKHIALAEEHGYRYQVFNMIHGGNDKKGRSKIAGIDPMLRDVSVRKEGEDWIATTI